MFLTGLWVPSHRLVADYQWPQVTANSQCSLQLQLSGVDGAGGSEPADPP